MKIVRKIDNRKQSREWYKKNRDYKIAHYRQWAEQNIAWLLWANAKRKSTKFKLRFNITPADCEVPDRCPVFGIKLKMGVGCSGPNSPTLDRLNPKLGYIRGNVTVISQFANSLKGNASAKQHRTIADWMDSRA